MCVLRTGLLAVRWVLVVCVRALIEVSVLIGRRVCKVRKWCQSPSEPGFFSTGETTMLTVHFLTLFLLFVLVIIVMQHLLDFIFEFLEERHVGLVGGWKA